MLLSEIVPHTLKPFSGKGRKAITIIMSTARKPDARRGEVSFIFAIILGLALGLLIKRVKVGLLIGVVLGLIIVFLGARSSRK